MRISSPAFEPGAAIPRKYTSEGDDLAPPLYFTGVPRDSKSLVLIVDDPDAPDPAAPQRTWVHWVVFNLPPETPTLPEGGAIPSGASEGRNDWRRLGYGGPSPPIGRHRYHFKLYALNTVLRLNHPGKADLERAMRGHELAHAELIGTYQKH